MDKQEQALREISEVIPRLSSEERERFADEYKWAYKYYLKEPQYYPEPEVPIRKMKFMYRLEEVIKDIKYTARELNDEAREQLLDNLKEVIKEWERPHYTYATDENGRRLPPIKIGKIKF